MHDVLRQRILRKLESLPEDQIYQVMDFMEFLESKYAREVAQEASGLQKFAETLEDRLRKRAVNPANIREAFQLIAAADRVLSQVSQSGGWRRPTSEARVREARGQARGGRGMSLTPPLGAG
jgi:hypothetical protein